MEEENKDQTDYSGDEGDSSGRSYERSKIGFPYGDLDGAVEVVKPIYNRGGSSATFDQLVDWMGHENVSSGTFRVKVAAARIFGLVLVDKDNVALTPLGRDINDPHTEVAARAKAFLSVPLYLKIFNTYKGGPLPQKDADLEAVIESLGVASKQKKRARQTFQRSAEQAKVFNERKDRLLLPPGVSLDSTTPNGGASRKMDTPPVSSSTSIPSGDLNPMISMLFESLPPSGSEWSNDARQQWLEILRRAFDRVYKDKSES